MFDNYPNQAGSGFGSTPAPTGPSSSPEDIFAELERSPRPTANQSPAASTVPSFRSQGPASFAPGQTPTAQPSFGPMPAQPGISSLPPIQPMVSGGHSSLKYLLIGLATLVIILGGGFYVYNTVLLPKLKVASTTDNNNQQTASSTATSTEDGEQVGYSDEFLPPEIASSTIETPVGDYTTSTIDNSSTTTSTQVMTESVTSIASLDTDQDGLSDDEEKTLGTDINTADTDKDGLSDYEEVKTWKTNPKTADTDGDTYSDGQEVKARYNPLGPGKMTISQ